MFPFHLINGGWSARAIATNPYFMSKQKQDCSVALMTILSWVVEAPNERYAPQIGSSPPGIRVKIHEQSIPGWSRCSLVLDGSL